MMKSAESVVSIATFVLTLKPRLIGICHRSKRDTANFVHFNFFFFSNHCNPFVIDVSDDVNDQNDEISILGPTLLRFHHRSKINKRAISYLKYKKDHHN